MMFKTIGLCVMCAWAVVQVASAQADSAEGLLSQLAPSEPAPKPRTLGELNALAVPAPVAAPKPAAPAAPTVKPLDVKPPVPSVPVVAPATPAVPVAQVVKPPEVKEAVPPAVAKPTLTLPQPKKRTGGTSFLNRASTSTNTVQRETVIASDKIDFDNREGVILFDDNVTVNDPQFFMRTDRLLVFMNGTNDVSQVMAIGHVTFSNEMRTATCSKAVYTRKDGQVVLTGDVRLKSEGATVGEVRGEKVVIWIDDERVEVLEGATITLPPGALKKSNDPK